MSALAHPQRPGWLAIELVPLADRVRYMRLFRVAAVATLIGLAALTGHRASGALTPLAITAFAYLGLAAAWDWAWARTGSDPRWFSGLLLVDGVFLAWATYATGGTESPVRYVILLHLIAVALLASYRTSLKLALWHSLLTLLLYHGERTDVLNSSVEVINTGSEFDRLVAFIVVFWLVALATATLSAINERELRRRRLDLESLAHFAGDLEADTTPSTVADTLLRHLGEAYAITRAAVVTQSEGQVGLLAQRHCERLPVLVDRTVGPESVLRRVEGRGGTLLAQRLDPDADPWLATLMPDARHLIVVPLRSSEPLIASLVCEYRGRPGSRIERRVVSMVERFAAHAALALDNSCLLEEVRSAADTDGLTAIANRRAFDQALELEVSRVQRSGGPLSLMMLDIDHFKRLNDDYGHQVGDEVLRRVAAALSANCRTVDLPARYGGEEFAIILTGCHAHEAAQMGERLRRAASAAVGSPPITASAGVASYPDHAPDADALVAAADAALYRAKRQGRDRLCAAAEPGAPQPAASTADGAMT